jgi:hypothetical protein
VIYWLSELAGFPSTSLERRAGLLVIGGSMANLLAIRAALQRGGQTFLTGTELPVRGEMAYARRACFVHFETTHEDVKRLALLLRETAVNFQEQPDEQ